MLADLERLLRELGIEYREDTSGALLIKKKDARQWTSYSHGLDLVTGNRVRAQDRLLADARSWKAIKDTGDQQSFNRAYTASTSAERKLPLDYETTHSQALMQAVAGQHKLDWGEGDERVRGYDLYKEEKMNMLLGEGLGFLRSSEGHTSAYPTSHLTAIPGIVERGGEYYTGAEAPKTGKVRQYGVRPQVEVAGRQNEAYRVTAQGAADPERGTPLLTRIVFGAPFAPGAGYITDPLRQPVEPTAEGIIRVPIGRESARWFEGPEQAPAYRSDRDPSVAYVGDVTRRGGRVGAFTLGGYKHEVDVPKQWHAMTLLGATLGGTEDRPHVDVNVAYHGGDIELKGGEKVYPGRMRPGAYGEMFPGEKGQHPQPDVVYGGHDVKNWRMIAARLALSPEEMRKYYGQEHVKLGVGTDAGFESGSVAAMMDRVERRRMVVPVHRQQLVPYLIGQHTEEGRQLTSAEWAQRVAQQLPQIPADYKYRNLSPEQASRMASEHFPGAGLEGNIGGAHHPGEGIDVNWDTGLASGYAIAAHEVGHALYTHATLEQQNQLRALAGTLGDVRARDLPTGRLRGQYDYVEHGAVDEQHLRLRQDKEILADVAGMVLGHAGTPRQAELAARGGGALDALTTAMTQMYFGGDVPQVPVRGKRLGGREQILASQLGIPGVVDVQPRKGHKDMFDVTMDVLTMDLPLLHQVIKGPQLGQTRLPLEDFAELARQYPEYAEQLWQQGQEARQPWVQMARLGRNIATSGEIDAGPSRSGEALRGVRSKAANELDVEPHKVPAAYLHQRIAEVWNDPYTMASLTVGGNELLFPSPTAMRGIGSAQGAAEELMPFRRSYEEAFEAALRAQSIETSGMQGVAESKYARMVGEMAEIISTPAARKHLTSIPLTGATEGAYHGSPGVFAPGEYAIGRMRWERAFPETRDPVAYDALQDHLDQYGGVAGTLRRPPVSASSQVGMMGLAISNREYHRRGGLLQMEGDEFAMSRQMYEMQIGDVDFDRMLAIVGASLKYDQRTERWTQSTPGEMWAAMGRWDPERKVYDRRDMRDPVVRAKNIGYSLGHRFLKMLESTDSGIPGKRGLERFVRSKLWEPTVEQMVASGMSRTEAEHSVGMHARTIPAGQTNEARDLFEKLNRQPRTEQELQAQIEESFGFGHTEDEIYRGTTKGVIAKQQLMPDTYQQFIRELSMMVDPEDKEALTATYQPGLDLGEPSRGLRGIMSIKATYASTGKYDPETGEKLKEPGGWFPTYLSPEEREAEGWEKGVANFKVYDHLSAWLTSQTEMTPEFVSKYATTTPEGRKKALSLVKAGKSIYGEESLQSEFENSVFAKWAMSSSMRRGFKFRGAGGREIVQGRGLEELEHGLNMREFLNIVGRFEHMDPSELVGAMRSAQKVAPEALRGVLEQMIGDIGGGEGTGAPNLKQIANNLRLRATGLEGQLPINMDPQSAEEAFGVESELWDIMQGRRDVIYPTHYSSYESGGEAGLFQNLFSRIVGLATPGQKDSDAAAAGKELGYEFAQVAGAPPGYGRGSYSEETLDVDNFLNTGKPFRAYMDVPLDVSEQVLGERTPIEVKTGYKGMGRISTKEQYRRVTRRLINQKKGRYYKGQLATQALASPTGKVRVAFGDPSIADPQQRAEVAFRQMQDWGEDWTAEQLGLPADVVRGQLAGMHMVEPGVMGEAAWHAWAVAKDIIPGQGLTHQDFREESRIQQALYGNLPQEVEVARALHQSGMPLSQVASTMHMGTPLEQRLKAAETHLASLDPTSPEAQRLAMHIQGAPQTPHPSRTAQVIAGAGGRVPGGPWPPQKQAVQGVQLPLPGMPAAPGGPTGPTGPQGPVYPGGGPPIPPQGPGGQGPQGPFMAMGPGGVPMMVTPMASQQTLKMTGHVGPSGASWSFAPTGPPFVPEGSLEALKEIDRILGKEGFTGQVEDATEKLRDFTDTMVQGTGDIQDQIDAAEALSDIQDPRKFTSPASSYIQKMRSQFGESIDRIVSADDQVLQSYGYSKQDQELLRKYFQNRKGDPADQWELQRANQMAQISQDHFAAMGGVQGVTAGGRINRITDTFTNFLQEFSIGGAAIRMSVIDRMTSGQVAKWPREAMGYMTAGAQMGLQMGMPHEGVEQTTMGRLMAHQARQRAFATGRGMSVLESQAGQATIMAGLGFEPSYESGQAYGDVVAPLAEGVGAGLKTGVAVGTAAKWMFEAGAAAPKTMPGLRAGLMGLGGVATAAAAPLAVVAASGMALKHMVGLATERSEDANVFRELTEMDMGARDDIGAWTGVGLRARTFGDNAAEGLAAYGGRYNVQGGTQRWLQETQYGRGVAERYEEFKGTQAYQVQRADIYIQNLEGMHLDPTQRRELASLTTGIGVTAEQISGGGAEDLIRKLAPVVAVGGGEQYMSAIQRFGGAMGMVPGAAMQQIAMSMPTTTIAQTQWTAAAQVAAPMYGQVGQRPSDQAIQQYAQKMDEGMRSWELQSQIATELGLGGVAVATGAVPGSPQAIQISALLDSYGLDPSEKGVVQQLVNEQYSDFDKMGLSPDQMVKRAISQMNRMQPYTDVVTYGPEALPETPQAAQARQAGASNLVSLGTQMRAPSEQGAEPFDPLAYMAERGPGGPAGQLMAERRGRAEQERIVTRVGTGDPVTADTLRRENIIEMGKGLEGFGYGEMSPEAISFMGSYAPAADAPESEWSRFQQAIGIAGPLAQQYGEPGSAFLKAQYHLRQGRSPQVAARMTELQLGGRSPMAEAWGAAPGTGGMVEYDLLEGGGFEAVQQAQWLGGVANTRLGWSQMSEGFGQGPQMAAFAEALEARGVGSGAPPPGRGFYTEEQVPTMPQGTRGIYPKFALQQRQWDQKLLQANQERTLRPILEQLERIQGPLREFKDNMRAINKEMRDAQYEQQVEGVQHSMASLRMQRRHALESLELQERMFHTRTEYQRGEYRFRGAEMQTQFEWQREDMALGRQMAGYQFEFQQGEMERAIRLSGGREKQRLMRQQEYQETMFSFGETQRGTQQERFETQAGWQEDRFEREVAHFEEMTALQQEQFDMQRRHIEEKFALEMAHLQRQMEHIGKMKQLNEDRVKLEENLEDLKEKWKIEELERTKSYYVDVLFPYQQWQQQTQQELADNEAMLMKQKLDAINLEGQAWTEMVNMIIEEIEEKYGIALDRMSWSGITVDQLEVPEMKPISPLPETPDPEPTDTGPQSDTGAQMVPVALIVDGEEMGAYLQMATEEQAERLAGSESWRVYQ